MSTLSSRASVRKDWSQCSASVCEVEEGTDESGGCWWCGTWARCQCEGDATTPESCEAGKNKGEAGFAATERSERTTHEVLGEALRPARWSTLVLVRSTTFYGASCDVAVRFPRPSVLPPAAAVRPGISREWRRRTHNEFRALLRSLSDVVVCALQVVLGRERRGVVVGVLLRGRGGEVGGRRRERCELDEGDAGHLTCALPGSGRAQKLSRRARRSVEGRETLR